MTLRALLLAACVTSACTVALKPSGAPRGTPPATPTPIPTATTTPTATAVPPVEPTPLAHLEKLPYDDALVPAPAGATAVPAAAIAPELASAPLAVSAGTVTLARRGNLLLGPGRIGGRAIGDVLLDTGAGATFVDRAVADQIGLHELVSASTDGAREAGEPSVRELPGGLALGELALAAERAFVVDLGATEGTVGGPFAGVVGFPTFGTAPFTIDFRNGTLTIHGDAGFEPPAGVPADALRIDQGLPFVEATLADGTSVWLLLDTGSPLGLSVWRGFAKQHPGVVKAAASTAADALPGTSELRGVSLLGERYERLPVVIETGVVRVWQRARVVGRIGMDVLHDLRITIHPATERIWVERPAPYGTGGSAYDDVRVTTSSGIASIFW